MSKAKRTNIEVQGTSIAILSQPGGDYISLTDMVRERINNPDFKKNS